MSGNYQFYQSHQPLNYSTARNNPSQYPQISSNQFSPAPLQNPYQSRVPNPQSLDSMVTAHMQKQRQKQLQNRLQAANLEQRIQKYRNSRLEDQARKRREQDLRAQELQRGVQQKRIQQEVLLRQKQKEDQMALNRANQAKAEYFREEQLKKQLLRQQAQFNQSYHNQLRNQQFLQKKQFQTDVVELQDQYAREQQEKQQKYRQMYSNIQKVQEKRQNQFQQLFLQPQNKRISAIEQKTQADYLQMQELAKLKQREDRLSQRQAKQELTRYLGQQTQQKRDLIPARVPNVNSTDSSIFQLSAHKFYGLEESPQIYGELLSNQRAVTPARLCKTSVKSMSHDPITGEIRNYNRKSVRDKPLGKGQAEIFPGKILDSPPINNKYLLPEYGKKIPRYAIFNPLTHQNHDVRTMIVSGSMQNYPRWTGMYGGYRNK